jgi:hypothetical protein
MPIQPTAPPPHPCDVEESDRDLPGFHHCPGITPGVDFSFYFNHPGESRTHNSTTDPRETFQISSGFNFGVILLPYVRDWGVSHAIMTRRKAYPTILHSFARNHDRGFALSHIQAFVSRRDNNLPTMILYLIIIPPFAGYRWNAHALRKWLDYAQAQAESIGQPASLSGSGAAAAATAWCEAVRGYWATLTVERFPYSAPDLVKYWRAPDTPPALS